jgi:exopolyphosphatase/guanosine-5'-triphosphate,3'-diphosphate pyrophosphatase
MALAGRRELPCIGRERADLVVAGCAILESILDLWPAHRLGVADRGIREGILRSLIGADDAAPPCARPRPAPSLPRQNGETPMSRSGKTPTNACAPPRSARPLPRAG